MKTRQLIQRKVAEVQSCIVNCPNDEPMVEGETLWMTARSCSVQDLLDDCNVLERLHEAVCERLRCPKCDATFDPWSDVGTRHDFEVEQWKYDRAQDKERNRAPKLDAGYEAFTRFLKETITDEAVPDGTPPAIPWDDLAAKKKWTPAALKKGQVVRSKLNVPRERFRIAEDGSFVWAGV